MLSYETILVGIDFDDLGTAALDGAAVLAGWVGAKRLHLVHVASLVPTWAGSPADISAGMFEVAWKAASEASERRLEAMPKPKTTAAITHETRMGVPVPELVAAAEAVRADLIVLASHRRGRLGRFVLGSVATALLRVVPCPVLVLGADRKVEGPFRQVVAAVDLSPVSGLVLANAVRMAMLGERRLAVVSVAEIAGPLEALAGASAVARTRAKIEAGLLERHRAEVKAVVERAREGTELDVQTEIRIVGNPKAVILDFARERAADLLVIGTSGHNAWERMVLGSTATHVVADAPCPVLVCPTPAPEARQR